MCGWIEVGDEGGVVRRTLCGWRRRLVCPGGTDACEQCAYDGDRRRQETACARCPLPGPHCTLIGIKALLVRQFRVSWTRRAAAARATAAFGVRLWVVTSPTARLGPSRASSCIRAHTDIPERGERGP